MDNVRTLQGDLLARDLRFAIVAARFNDAIVENLIRGAVDMLLRHGASEKQIALQLELSRHTVHNYVKALHQRFGVSSRGELLAKAGQARADAGPRLSVAPPRRSNRKGADEPHDKNKH